MAWTLPRTWVVGEVVTASIMNAHVRDNFSGGPVAASISALNALFPGGTPGQGARGFLELGSSPYAFLGLTYDANYGKWTSDEMPIANIYCANNGAGFIAGPLLGGSGAGGNGYSAAPQNNGCTLQVKGRMYLGGTGNAVTASCGFVACSFNASGTNLANPAVQVATGLENTTTTGRIDWTTMGSLGGATADTFMLGSYVQVGSFAFCWAGSGVARWVA